MSHPPHQPPYGPSGPQSGGGQPTPVPGGPGRADWRQHPQQPHYGQQPHGGQPGPSPAQRKSAARKIVGIVAICIGCFFALGATTQLGNLADMPTIGYKLAYRAASYVFPLLFIIGGAILVRSARR
jgi:hypothetical protein